MICLPHHPAHWLILIVVGAWLIPGVLLRASPGVLAVAWALEEDHWCRTGNPLPLKLFMALDAACISALLFIIAWRGMRCRNILCPANRREFALLAVFLPMGAVYAASMSRAAQWWTLWGLTLTQFALAGGWPAFGKNRTKEFRRGFTKEQPVWTRGG